MDIKVAKTYLTLQDLKRHSVWKFNEADDLTYPVNCAEDFPEGQYDLSIRANFTTPSGIELFGYLVGIKNIFSIAILCEGQEFYFNRNLPEDYAKTLDSLSKVLGQKLTINEFSPLKYVTDIDLEGFRNIEGEFDLLQKRTDEERLKDL